MDFEVADFPGFKAGFECVEVVLGLGLAVEDVAVQLHLLVSELARRHHDLPGSRAVTPQPGTPAIGVLPWLWPQAWP